MTAAIELFALDRCHAYPLPDNRVLVHNLRNGNKSVLTPDVYAALLECQVFHSLDDHAQRLTAKSPALGGQEVSIRQVLESVRKDRLLISSAIYGVMLQPSARPARPVDKPVAAIITWERPEALARCLESLRENCKLRKLDRLYVIDDSRSADIIEKNRNTTESFAVHAPVKALYMGEAVQRQFMEDIIGQIPDRAEAVRFLLDRQRWSSMWTSGLARTVALLISVGHRLLVLDDDILCEVHETGDGNGVSFSDAPREAAFYSDNAQWSKLRAASDTDPLARHGRFLGATLGDALAALGSGELPPESFTGARVEHLEALGADSRVLVTECGSLGDPGTARSNWLTGLEGASRARLLESADSVNAALSIRNYWNGRSKPHFASRSNMSQLTGLDNRQCLPPYTPVLRNEDRLFGDMVDFIFPGAVVLDQAWALPHLPIPPRSWSGKNAVFATGESFPGFFLALVRDSVSECHATETTRRGEHIADLLQDLSDHDHEAIVARYHDHLMDSQAFHYHHLKRVMAASEGAPQAWIDYLEDGISRLNTEIVAKLKDRVVSGYPRDLKAQKLTAFWRDYWKDFAAALRAWPDIRQAASNCRP